MEQARTETTEWEISVAFVSSANSFQVGSGENQPENSFCQFKSMEIDDQSQRYVEQLHAAEQRRLVNGMNRLDGLYFNKQTIVNQQIGNREITSVISVDSCLVHLHHILSVPSRTTLIDRQLGKLFLSHS